jgi:Ca2+-binding RTX toxin-like protein
VLAGGSGNDQLTGETGNDTYVFGIGDGRDTVFDSGGSDALRLGAGIAPDAVRVRATAQDFQLHLNAADVLTLQLAMAGLAWRIESVAFADHPGVWWSMDDLLARARIPTDGADWLPGGAGPERIAAGAGNDTVSGNAGDDTLEGGPGLDSLLGGEGADSLSGDADNDWLDGGEGDDHLHGGAGADALSGGAGDDTYFFAAGHGADTVSEAGGFDELSFADGLAPADLVARFSGGNLQLSFRGTQDGVLLQGWTTPAQRVERVRFADGTQWDEDALRARGLEPTEGADVLPGGSTADALSGLGGNDSISGGEGDDRLAGGAGNDTLSGNEGADTLGGGAGDDFLSGDAGDDVFEYDRGDGIDRIADSSGADVLRFGAGIAPADVRVARRLDDFELWLRDGSGRVVLAGAASPWSSAARIETVAFADGSAWDDAELRRRAREATAGADTLVGGDAGDTLAGLGGDDVLRGEGGDDLLEGGAGTDWLAGGAGDDSYRFSPGDGSDRAQETGTGFDTVLLGDGLTPGNLLVQVSSLGMTLSSGADQLMLYGNGNEAAPQFERLVFADGTQWDVAAMFAAARRTTPGADSILGTAAAERYDADGGDDTVFAYAGADTLLGGAGNDSLSGGEGNDLLDGGPGDDRLFGEWNDDEYVFARGAGNDTLFDTAGLDRVRVAPGILPEDLRVALDGGGTLRLILRDGGGSLAMQSWTTPNYRIEHVMFDDGTDWDEAALRVRALEATDGADVLGGTSADEHVAGLGGDDTIAGDAGADTLEGGAGRDWILGGAGNDVLAGGPGADSLEGGSADDRYRVAPGDGIDIVTDTGGLDVLEFSAGIAPADVTGRFQGNDLVLHYGATDRVTLGYWRIASNQVEQVVFADGTRWDAARLAQLALQPSAGPDLITGTAAAERLDGGAGDDTLQGGEGNDTLAGGPGADQLQGGTGDDEYLLARGDGSDVVVDAGGADTLRFAASIAPADVRVSAEAGRHLVLALRDGSGAVRLDSVLRVDSQRIEQVRFADGTVWTHADLVAFATDPVDGNRLLTGQAGPDALTGGPGEDTLRGLEGADTLDGGAGDDRLEGGAGADAYVVRPGEGTDWIVEAAQSGVGEDVLQLRGVAPAAVRVWRDARHLHLDLGDGAAGRATLSDWYSGSAAARIEAVSFDDGTRWLGADLERMAATATAAADSLLGSAGGDALDGGAGDDALWGLEGADTLRGGPGDDTLAGGRGRDEIRFDAGDGRDELDASGGGVAEDVLALGAGLDPARLRVCSEGMDLVIGFTGAEDSIRVRRWWQGPARQLAELRFHDGTSLSNAQLAALAATATDGPDRLSGSPGPDTLAGGRGDDRLLGGDGDDTYLFAAGDGADRIADTAGADVLRFGEGIAPSRLAVRRDGNDALLSVDDDLVRIEDAWAAGTGDGQGWSAGRGAIERVEFADGTRWDAAVLRLRALGPAPAAVEPIPDRRVSEGAPFAFTLPEGAFTTVRRDGLAWSVALAEGGALPAWLRFDAATHALQGHAPEAAVGRWSLVATARDAAGQSARSAFVLDVADVNHAPRIVRGVPDVVLRAGETRAFALPDGFAADDDAGDALAVSLRGAGGIELPGWITFDAATGRIEAAPPAGSREALGLEVVVTDRAGAIAVAPFRLAVAAPNLAPRAATVLVPPPLVAGEPWLWRLPANAFNDPDSRRAPQLSVSGPEDGPLPHWLRFDPDTATLHGVAPGDTAGPVALRLVAEDAHGGIALQELVLQVLPSAGDAGLVAREAGGAMNGDSTSAAIDGASAALTGGVSPAFTGEAPASVLRDAPVAVSLSLRGAWRAPDGAGGEVAVQVDGRTVASVALGTRVRTHELALALRPGEAHRLAIVAPESLAAAGARAEIHAVSVAGLALAPLPGGPFLDAFDPASGAGVRAATRGGALVFAVPAFAAGVPSGDRLWGGVGATAMAGGAGSDTYVLDHAGDAVTERPGGGFDELQAWRDAVLPAHVEVLALAGEAREGTGNDAANRLFGSAGADRLHGAGGSDVLHGGGGDDRLEGGAPLPAQLVITARGGAGAGASARMSVKVNGVPLAVIAVACGAFAEYAIELPGTLVGQPLDVRIALAGGLGFGTAARAGGLEVAEVRLGEARLQGAGASAQGSRFERVAADGDLPGFLLLRSSGEAAFGFAAPVPARDLLDGGAGDDTLVGTGLLAGGRGDDLLVPGPGVSVLAFARGDGQDVVDVRAAQRLVLSLSGMPAVDVSASREEGDLVLDMGGADSVRLAHWYEPGFGVPLVLQHFDAAWEAASAGGGMRVSTSADEGAVDIEHALQRLVQAEAAFVSAGVLGGAAAAAHAAGASLAGLEFAALQPVLGDRAFGVAPQPA